MRKLVGIAGGALLVCAAACGGSNSGDIDASVMPEIDARIPMPIDAGPDANLSDAVGPPVDDAGVQIFGPAIILDEIHFALEGHAWSGWAPIVNPLFDMAVDDGEMILLIELRGLDDPSGQNDPDGLDIAIYVGTDPDLDPSNNFSGTASLRVAEESLDGVGNPRALLPDATLADGRISGSIEGEITMFLPTLGAVKVQDPVFGGDLVASGDNESIVELQNATLAGTMLARHLEEVANPVPDTCLAQSLLDLVALPCLAFDGVQPDVDVDGDGLETFDEFNDVQDGAIDICTDGNGFTYISTPTVQCVLDPAFQDAFTAELEVRGVRAFLLPPL